MSKRRDAIRYELMQSQFIRNDCEFLLDECDRLERERDALADALRAAKGSYDAEMKACADAEHQRDALADALRELVDWLGPDSPRADRGRAALDRHTQKDKAVT